MSYESNFEDKVRKYLYEANHRFKSVSSTKLKELLFYDIRDLITLVYDSDIVIDYNMIYKYSMVGDIVEDALQNDSNGLLDFKFSRDSSDKYDEYFLHNYNECLETNRKIGQLGDYLESIYGFGYIKDFKIKLDIAESIKLCKDFFDYYDKDISKFFNRMLDRENLYFCESIDGTYLGYTLDLFSQNDAFVIVQDNGNIMTPIVIAHEIIHAYMSSYFAVHSADDLYKVRANSLGETYSSFIELVFLNYLKEIHFSDYETDALGLYFDNDLISFLVNYNDELKYHNSDHLLNNEYLFGEYAEDELYSFGKVLAHHYLDKYLENPSKCKDNITNLSIDDRKYDRKYLLNNYGLKEENLGKSRVLTKHMKEHYKY